MPEHVMTPKQKQKYVFDRKLPIDSDKDEIMQIAHFLRTHQHSFLHNGFLDITNFLNEHYERKGISVQSYIPKDSSEVHYFTGNGDLHVVNSRGNVRYKRDLLQLEFLQELTDAPTTVIHYGDSLDAARDHFTHLARDKVNLIFSELDSERINDQGALYVFCGPLTTHFSDKTLASTLKEDHYLNHLVFDVGDKSTVHLDYLFGDQIESVVKEFCVKAANIFGESMPIHFLYDGKYGGLTKPVNKEILPKGVIGYNSLLTGATKPSPLDNQLAIDGQAREIFLESVKNPPLVTSVHMNSVMDQTKEEIALATKNGQVMDMELLILNYVSKIAPQPVFIYASGVVSDEPGNGKPLSSSNYNSSLLRNHFAAFYSIVSNHEI